MKGSAARDRRGTVPQRTVLPSRSARTVEFPDVVTDKERIMTRTTALVARNSAHETSTACLSHSGTLHGFPAWSVLLQPSATACSRRGRVETVTVTIVETIAATIPIKMIRSKPHDGTHTVHAQHTVHAHGHEFHPACNIITALFTS